MKKIFVIDDDQTYLKVLKKHFELIGHEVVTFDHVEDTLNSLKEKPDLILLDHFFDQSQSIGYEYIKTIKSSTKAPILYLTAANDNDVKENALKRGAYAVLVKDESLLVHLRTTLDKLHKQKKTKAFFGLFSL